LLCTVSYIAVANPTEKVCSTSQKTLELTYVNEGIKNVSRGQYPRISASGAEAKRGEEIVGKLGKEG